MNITHDGWFEITWYLGYFCVIVVRPPIVQEHFDDEEEELLPQSQRVDRCGAQSSMPVIRPAFVCMVKGGVA